MRAGEGVGGCGGGARSDGKVWWAGSAPLLDILLLEMCKNSKLLSIYMSCAMSTFPSPMSDHETRTLPSF